MWVLLDASKGKHAFMVSWTSGKYSILSPSALEEQVHVGRRQEEGRGGRFLMLARAMDVQVRASPPLRSDGYHRNENKEICLELNSRGCANKSYVYCHSWNRSRQSLHVQKREQQAYERCVRRYDY